MTEVDLRPLGEAVRKARRQRDWTLQQLAERCGLSTRFLSDLERGVGNISIARLVAVAAALQVTVAELAAALDGRGQAGEGPVLSAPIALVGLRGAGKSTIGGQLAQLIRVPFRELDTEIETRAGLPLAQLFEIHGETYYRRLEHDCLTQVLETRPAGVIAAGGGLVMDRASWRMLRARARTVWLKARPEDHYYRVMAQGDLRPMENRPAAMAELSALLAARAPFYAEADLTLDTSSLGIERALDAIVRWVKEEGRREG